jgi:hypothetical protein
VNKLSEGSVQLPGMRIDRDRSSRATWFLCCLVCLVSLGSNSAPSQLMRKPVNTFLTSSEADLIREGVKSLVLFRVTVTEGRTNESIAFNAQPVLWNIWEVSDWDKPRRPNATDLPYKQLHWRIPSTSAGRSGWRYLVLDPGSYFMRIVPEEGAVPKYEVYRFRVQRGQPVVYAGSFHYRKAERGIWEHELEVLDETMEVQPVVREVLPRIQPIVSTIARPQQLESALAAYTNRCIVSWETSAARPARTPNVGDKAGFMATAPLMLPAIALYDDVEDSDEEESVRAQILGLMCHVVAVPFRIFWDATLGTTVRASWSPHEKALQREFVRFNMPTHLTNSIRRQLSTNSITSETTTSSSGLAVHIRVRKLGLQPSGWNYALKVAVLVSVFDATSRQLIWEGSFAHVWSDSFERSKNWVVDAYEISTQYKYVNPSVPFQSYTLASSARLPLKDFKNKRGLKRLEVELQKASEALSDRIVSEFQAAGIHCRIANDK